MNTVISQALATGLPVITTRHSGLPDQVKDGKNGFLVEEGDYKALAEKILFYLDNSELWPEYGKYGRKLVEKKYDAGPLIDEQIKCYFEVLNVK